MVRTGQGRKLDGLNRSRLEVRTGQGWKLDG